MMPNHSDARNARNKTTLSLSLAILIIIMDMSGLAGLAAQEELEEVQEKRETLSGINMPGFQVGLVNSSTTLSLQEDGFGGCVVLDDGTLWCWGSDNEHALGTANNGTAQSTPVLILGPAGSGAPVSTDSSTDLVVSVSLGVTHNCALVTSGDVWCWGKYWATGGYNAFEEAGPVKVTSLDRDATLIQSGQQHSCAILDNGSVQCWGSNSNGQLGLEYKCVTGAEGMCGVNGNAWGTGNGWQYFIAIPQYFILPTARTAVGLNVWDSNTCVILDDASYICAGSSFAGNGYSYYVNGTYSVAAADRWSAISSAGELLYLNGGTSGYLGKHTSWQLDSRNAANTSYEPGPQIGNNAKISTVSGGENNGNDWSPNGLCAIFSNGSLGCGDLYSYQNDATNYRGYLYQAWIETPVGTEAAAISSSDNRMTCMVLDNGSVQCWGINDGSYIGDGSTCIYGTLDTTGCTPENYVNSPRYVTLPAGRHVALEEMDADGDGIITLLDLCSSGVTGWTSNLSSDYDSDGCRDLDEDNDDDGDGYLDSNDSAPLDARFHHNLTMENGWVLGGRYEFVSASWCCDPNSMITEADSSIYQSVDSKNGYFVNKDGKLYDSNDDLISTNWDQTDSIIATSYRIDNAGADCVLLESGALRCWGNTYYGQAGGGDSYTNSVTSLSILESSNVSFPVSFSPTQISTGARTSCAVLENTEAYCWGYNQGNTHLGTGQNCDWNDYEHGCNGNYAVPVPNNPVLLPAGVSAATVYAGGHWNSASCVVGKDGNGYCWGTNTYGQLGNGNTNSVDANEAPEKVYLPPGINANIQTMALGEYSTCALWDNGSVYCWGGNNNGQLGDGTVCIGNSYENNCNGATAKPIIYDPVIFPSGEFAIAIWLGGPESYCSLLTSGGIWCWGNLITNETGSYTGIGEYQDLFPTGNFIQPGNRDLDSDGIFNTNDNCASGTQNWISTSSNDFDSDGCIDATEDDDDDNDGYTDTVEADCGTSPTNSSDVPLDPDNDGICNAFDLDDDNDGVLDINDEFPNDPYGFIQLSLGDGFQSGQPQDNATLGGSSRTTCVILTDNTLRCWGDNTRGQVGDGTRNTQRYTPVEVSVPANKNPVSVSASGTDGNHICATMDDGSLYCWGYNNYGQLGKGTNCENGNYINGCNGNNGISSPSQVTLPAGRTAEAVATGQHHTCAILDDGTVWCWGSNEYGQLGVANSSNLGNWRYSPNQVIMPDGTSTIAISLGYWHTCAVVDDGRSFCWGDNGYGQLGDGTFTDRNFPTQVSGSTQYISISLGQIHTCAITVQKTLQCWGSNGFQQLGYSGGSSSIPQNTLLPAGSQVSSIISGYYHTCAILTTMEMYCWGHDNNNRLNTEYQCNNDFSNGCYGDNRQTPALSQLPTGRNAIGAYLGFDYSCV